MSGLSSPHTRKELGLQLAPQFGLPPSLQVLDHLRLQPHLLTDGIGEHDDENAARDQNSHVDRQNDTSARTRRSCLMWPMKDARGRRNVPQMVTFRSCRSFVSRRYCTPFRFTSRRTSERVPEVTSEGVPKLAIATAASRITALLDSSGRSSVPGLEASQIW
jgi:hypothetical protein